MLGMSITLRIFVEPQQGATYDNILAVANAAADLGFEGFFRSDHFIGWNGDGRPHRQLPHEPGSVTNQPK
jgi:alkanesulfonate monooxygenase SsuD/methylene tetrahydromethanopterin reductase-like flavin-dependent oxidoreductase (luciferase family)